MGRQNAFTAQGLSIEQRRARLAAMIAAGEITAEQAALIDFRAPPKAVIEHGKRLAEALTAAEAQSKRASA